MCHNRFLASIGLDTYMQFHSPNDQCIDSEVPRAHMLPRLDTAEVDFARPIVDIPIPSKILGYPLYLE